MEFSVLITEAINLHDWKLMWTFSNSRRFNLQSPGRDNQYGPSIFYKPKGSARTRMGQEESQCMPTRPNFKGRTQEKPKGPHQKPNWSSKKKCAWDHFWKNINTKSWHEEHNTCILKIWKLWKLFLLYLVFNLWNIQSGIVCEERPSLAFSKSSSGSCLNKVFEELHIVSPIQHLWVLLCYFVSLVWFDLILCLWSFVLHFNMYLVCLATNILC